jgi:arylformamidase
MTIDYEAEYNNRARVPEHPAHIQGWARDAAAYRDVTPHVAGVAYGATPRAAYDFFPAPGAGEKSAGPVVLFIHGGYWQALDRSFFSHMAAGPNARGLTVAIMGYDLCPDVTMAAIVDQARQAALTLWRKTGRKVVAVGHSAGGHLTAALLATDWQALDAKAPADLVPAGLAISGLFELEPLVPTSVNLKLGLDLAEARRLSPALMTPNAGTRMDAFVGGAESDEYLRQSRDIAANWSAKGCPTRFAAIPGADHFTVIAGLAEPRSVLTEALISLASVSPSSAAPSPRG